MEPTSRGSPRLVIREMVLENFKSYAGAQRVGPFHKVSVLYILYDGNKHELCTFSQKK